LSGQPQQGVLPFGRFKIQLEALFAAMGGAENGALSVDERRQVEREAATDAHRALDANPTGVLDGDAIVDEWRQCGVGDESKMNA